LGYGCFIIFGKNTRIMGKPIVVLGVFVADMTFRSARMPKIGETLLGLGFALGPGGKGSNQAVAAGRLGADVSMLTRLGVDSFAAMAKQIWADAGVKPVVIDSPDSYTGAAAIVIEDATGNNGIIVSPGAAALISVSDIEAHANLISSAGIFITQLEQPMPAAIRALEIARNAGVITILNPAPAAHLSDAMLALCDYITPNETETEELTGVAVHNLDDARRAGDVFLSKGVGTALITLGDKGALLHSITQSVHVPVVSAGAVVETTGAGDAFNGGFARSLAEGMDPASAARFACAVAGISVTRAGAAASMPTLDEVQKLIQSQ
jgi:ribokinase